MFLWAIVGLIGPVISSLILIFLPSKGRHSCVIMHDDGTEETRIIEAKNLSAAQEQLKAQGFKVKIIPREVRIGGSLTVFLILCFFLVPWAPIIDVSFMSLHVVLMISLLWVLSCWKINPRKMTIPAILVFIVFLYVAAIWAHFYRGLEKMRPQGDTIVQALEGYHSKYGHYPQDLDQLPPDFINQIPDRPFHFDYFPHTDGSYGLVGTVPPFDVFYNRETKHWWQHIPD